MSPVVVSAGQFDAPQAATPPLGTPPRLPAQPAAGESSPGGRTGGRLAVLDGLRLVAALAVVTYHYTYHAPRTWGAPSTEVFSRTSLVTGYGWLGVELFFVISGFVICMSAWGRGLGRFFVSRVVRLYPAYWFAVLATTAVVAAVMVGHPRPSGTDLLVNLTMLQRPMGVPEIDGVYWTLWEELRFYLLFAIVIWRGLTYRRAVLFCLLWTVASVVVSGSPHAVLHLVVGDEFSPFFIAGIAFYLMHRFRPTILLWGIVGVSWALGLKRVYPTAEYVARSGDRPHLWLGVVLVVTGIFAVMAAISLGWLNWIRGGWLTIAGALTYPLYLLHQEIGYVVIVRLHDRVPKWPLLIGLLAAMLLAAWLVHRLVERPLAPRLKRALTAAMADAATADTAAGGTAVDQQPRRSG
nr:acyltransferase [Planosporangium mesophilum]